MKYNRILLKLSGESLQGAQGYGLSTDVLHSYAAQIRQVVEAGVQVAVVIGGGVSRAGAPLLEGARAGFLKYAFYPNRGIRFALAALGNDAGIYGCCKLILDRFA